MTKNYVKHEGSAFNDFNSWLVDEKTLSARSASDVISRINRVAKYFDVDLLKKNNNAEIDYLVEKLDATLSFTKSVKSQIKRAIKLYVEFSGLIVNEV